MAQVEFYSVVMIVVDAAAINLEKAFFAKVVFVVKILHATERTSRQLRAAHKGGGIAAVECATHSELNPIPVLGGSLRRFCFRSSFHVGRSFRWFLVCRRGMAGAEANECNSQ